MSGHDFQSFHEMPGIFSHFAYCLVVTGTSRGVTDFFRHYAYVTYINIRNSFKVFIFLFQCVFNFFFFFFTYLVFAISVISC